MLPSNQANPRLVLVVDDDPELAGLVGQVLGDEGYSVEVCLDSRDAVQRVNDLRPAALILDVMMPNVDGWSVLREVRSTRAGRDLPVVLMSGGWRANEKQREIGTTGKIAPTLVLPKPFELRDLDRCLRQMGVSPG